MISKGKVILVEDKAVLMEKLGKKQLSVQLQSPIAALPPQLAGFQLELSPDGSEITYTYDAQQRGTGIAGLMRELSASGLDFHDIQTRQSSLEDIFVSLVSTKR